MKKDITLRQKANEAYGSRILAGIIDLVLWILLFIVTALLFGTSKMSNHGTTKNTSVSLTGLPFIIFVLVELAYFVILEWVYGVTLGKLLLGVKVTDEAGGRITFKQSLIRNALRLVDGFPYVIPYVTGLIIVAGDNHKRRVGDKAANTLVILKSGYPKRNNWDNLS